MHNADNQLVIYDLICCIYLCLKLESQAFGTTFEQFVSMITSLGSYKDLKQELTGDKIPLAWHESIYPAIEKEILRGLRFSTELVSCSQLVYELLVTYSCQEDPEHSHLETVLQQAQFRSYLCILGK